MESHKDIVLNKDYTAWLGSLKEQIRVSQIKAAVQVNKELLHLYWNLGVDIVAQQETAKWGDGFLQQLSVDLLREFPEMKGLSYRNLRAIKQWYITYRPLILCNNEATDNQENAIWQQLVAKLDKAIGKQLVSQFADIFFSVPWGHHLTIMQKCKSLDKAIFYLYKTVENNWSRAVLLNILDTNLYERQGRAISNFSRTLPEPQSDLAQQTLKDPYNFDFLTMREGYMERELEDALTANVTRFLIELGKGFAYVGRQIQMEVGDQTFFPDLLFYHLELRCYVVIELKAVAFDPAFLGQLNFYVSAIDHKMRKPMDAPTIGLLVCKTKDDVVAQYALEGYNRPLGISAFELSNLIPKEFKSALPSIEEIEQGLREE